MSKLIATKVAVQGLQLVGEEKETEEHGQERDVKVDIDPKAFLIFRGMIKFHCCTHVYR